MQLANFLAEYRKKTYGSSSLNLSELMNWCNDRSKVPEGDDDFFVSEYDSGNDEIETLFFRFFAQQNAKFDLHR